MSKQEEKNQTPDDSQKQRNESSSKELKDEQLGNVAGGTTNVCTICGVTIPCACIP